MSIICSLVIRNDSHLFDESVVIEERKRAENDDAASKASSRNEFRAETLFEREEGRRSGALFRFHPSETKRSFLKETPGGDRITKRK